MKVEPDAGFDSNKVLIVYFSRINNTKAIAEIIQDNVGGTSVALEAETNVRNRLRKINLLK